jgi:hypothetical protein
MAGSHGLYPMIRGSTMIAYGAFGAASLAVLLLAFGV